jgi:hypothetical protein
MILLSGSLIRSSDFLGLSGTASHVVAAVDFVFVSIVSRRGKLKISSFKVIDEETLTD